MARSKGRRGRKGKGKRKRKGKKTKTEAEPPPLHLLTELYKKLENATRQLYELRVATRKKRLEGWFMTREMVDIKNDNQLYNDYLNENIDGLQKAIDKFLKLIQEERDAINKAIAELTEKLEKQRLEYEAKSAAIETELTDVRLQLLEFEPMMEELARLMAILEALLKEIEAAKVHATMKVRHLTNQFLDQRARLHNHLEEQLFNLIKHCRTFVMPILWNFMQGLIFENLCERWKLARTDEKNIMLAEKRDELMSRRKVLQLEKPYWNIEWAFFKLAEVDAARSRRKAEAEAKQMLVEAEKGLEDDGSKPGTPITTTGTGFKQSKKGMGRPLDPHPTTQLGKDFNVFLIRRLTAAKEAQERHDQEVRREERRYMREVLKAAKAKKKDKDKEKEKEKRDSTITDISSLYGQSQRLSHISDDLDFYNQLLLDDDWEDVEEEDDQHDSLGMLDEDEEYDDDEDYGEEEMNRSGNIQAKMSLPQEVYDEM